MVQQTAESRGRAKRRTLFTEQLAQLAIHLEDDGECLLVIQETDVVAIPHELVRQFSQVVGAHPGATP